MAEEIGTPELGELVRTAREARGWTVDMLSVALGFFGKRTPYVLGRTQLTRLEAGGRTVTVEEAWRLVEVFDEVDPWELLVAAQAVDTDASPEFRERIIQEAEQRRAQVRQSGGRRRRGDRLLVIAAASRSPAYAGLVVPGSGQTGDLPEPPMLTSRVSAA